jgi:tRNA1(Val) A37 N6-methylase TrmN6
MSSPKAPTTDATLSGATLDQFLGGRITVLQPEQGHRAGSDAVWLAAAVEANAGERVLDVGAGVGVAGLCLLARIPGLEVTAVEMDAGLCTLAASNAARNAVAGKFKVVEADVTAPADLLAAKGLLHESYDHVMANPPYHVAGTVRTAPDERRAFAHVMGDGALEDWVRFLASMAAPKGWLTLIHRPDSLTMLLKLLERRFGDVAVFPLFPRAGEAATRILLKGRKGSRRGGVTLLQGLVLHEADGRYTPMAEAVLRQGAALKFGCGPVCDPR